MINEASRGRLIWTMVRRDLGHVRHHGLYGLIGFSVLLFVLMMVFHVRVVRELVTQEQFEWTVYGWADEVQQRPEMQDRAAGIGDNFRFNGLELEYGLMAFTAVLLTCFAFGAAYGAEMRRGTVRTLTCHPVGYLEITLAKVIYAGIVGFGLSLVVNAIPWLTLAQVPVVPFLALVVAVAATLLTIAAGALAAGAIVRWTGRMWIRPTTFGIGLTLISFLTTQRLVELVVRMLATDPSLAVALRPVILLSPFHEAGGLLAWAIGGPPASAPWLLLWPVAIIAIGWRASAGVLPDCYERE